MKRLLDRLARRPDIVVAITLPPILLLAPATAAAQAQGVLPTSFQETLEAFISAALMGVVGFVLNWVRVHFNLVADQRTRAYLDEAIENAVHFGAARVVEWAGRTDLHQRTVKDQLVRQGVQYVQAVVPDAVNRFGMKPEDLALLVEARLGKLAGLVADPTVPAAPGPKIPPIDAPPPPPKS
jgi:hypothetical protein